MSARVAIEFHFVGVCKLGVWEFRIVGSFTPVRPQLKLSEAALL